MIVSILTVDNLSFTIASAFVVCILAGVFQLSRTVEKMGDDIK